MTEGAGHGQGRTASGLVGFCKHSVEDIWSCDTSVRILLKKSTVLGIMLLDL